MSVRNWLKSHKSRGIVRIGGRHQTHFHFTLICAYGVGCGSRSIHKATILADGRIYLPYDDYDGFDGDVGSGCLADDETVF